MEARTMSTYPQGIGGDLLEHLHTIEPLGLLERFSGLGQKVDAQGRKHHLLDLCGGRTILKRGKAVLKYVRWYREEFLTDYAFPACGWKTDAFMDHLVE